MHETGVIQDLVRQIERVAAQESKPGSVARVSRITLVVGDSAGFEAGHLEFHFRLAAKGTVAEGAALDIGSQPGGAIKLVSLELEE